MSHSLIYIIIIFIGVCLIGVILHLLIHKKLSESNAMLWLFIGLVVVLAGLFPKLVERLSGFFFITYPPAFVFTVAIIILLFIVLKNTINISELTAKLQDTATEASILQYEIDDLKRQLETLKKQNTNGIDET